MLEFDIAALKDTLDYNPENGEFRWKKTKFPSKLGAIAGGLNNKGYTVIELKGKFYSAHRLAWAYMTNAWPKTFVDHINGIRNDNRFCNLRLANSSGNRCNSGKNKNNTSGYKGVVFKPGNKLRPWQAATKQNGKWIYIGAFKTPEEAHAAYCDVAQRLHGDFHRP